MGIETIEFKGKRYPAFQSKGNAAKFILPFALEILDGVGYDIGSGLPSWAFPGLIKIDPAIPGSGDYDAHNLPENRSGGLDYIFSSHCLEHLNDWMDTLDYWVENIKSGGVLFLYLPDISQNYWAYGNRKHVNVFTPEIIKGYMVDRGMKNIFVSGVDLNNSFSAMCEVP